MDSEGWHYHDRYRELESLFWQTFREEAHNFSNANLYLIRAARMAGLFYHYGFNFDTKGVVQSVRTDQPDGSLAYLDAFCAGGEWAPLSQAGGWDVMSGCKFTKRICTIPGKATWTSKGWAVAVLAHIQSADWGLPTIWISDMDPKFVRGFWQSMFNALRFVSLQVIKAIAL
ncbi:hypothetical protein PENFLA_c045G00936 [Penicillium flavigenum]|uniref:Uncharacterized protein n=1 Tax=Penicillium flavigenum TaxID=254877 RepID=A0A1V6SIS4_9EURO|nr:hypothetical protein PENFLA_c045G00936 [Penicillium flavigenum]